jgi:hypothetical protein
MFIVRFHFFSIVLPVWLHCCRATVHLRQSSCAPQTELKVWRAAVCANFSICCHDYVMPHALEHAVTKVTKNVQRS